MIQRGDPITVLHSYRAPVRGLVTVVTTHTHAGVLRNLAIFDWAPVETQSPGFTIFLLSEFSEGWIWVRGHGEEQDRALLTVRALA